MKTCDVPGQATAVAKSDATRRTEDRRTRLLEYDWRALPRLELSPEMLELARQRAERHR